MEAQATTVFKNGLPRLRQLLAQGAQRLRDADIETARLDAEVILLHVLSMTREQLLTAADFSLNEIQLRHYDELLRRRLLREPVAYITGRREFWSLDFHVTRGVLIPRPDTERLLEVSLALARESPQREPPKILDIGTGSGVLAISLAKELPKSVLWATDVSTAALTVALDNALRHGVADRVQFLHGDLLAPVDDMPRRFDLIVANPPYIRSADIDALGPEVSLWEPRGALDGGDDGLGFYRRLAWQAHSCLAPNGAIAVETGADRGKDVARLFTRADRYTDVTIFQDYAGRERVVVAKRAGQSAN